MPVAKLPLATGAYEERTASNSDLRCENYYPHTPKNVSLSDRILRATHGIAGKGFFDNSASTTTLIAGGVATDDRIYVVTQEFGGVRALYAVAVQSTVPAGYTATTETSGDSLKFSYKELDREDLFSDPYGEFYDIAVSGTHVVVVYSNKGIVYNIGTDTKQNIIDADYTANGNPNGVAFVDGYFVFTTDERKFIISALNDPTSFNALDFSSAEMDPDGCVCPFVWRNQLYIGGTRTIEQFNNIGAADFPFERTGQFFEVGVNSPRGLIEHETGIYFDGVGKNGERGIYRLTDSVEQINSFPLKLMYDADSVPDLRAFTYAFDEHEFIGFYFNFSDYAWVYDLTENAWHKRTNSSAPYFVAPLNGYTVAFGGYDSAASIGNAIGQIDGTTFTAYSANVSRLFTTAPVHRETAPFTISSLEITTDTDQATGFTLELSEDGGDSWSTVGTVTHGVPAASDRYIWRRLGRADETMQFRFTSTASALPHHVYQLMAGVDD